MRPRHLPPAVTAFTAVAVVLASGCASASTTEETPPAFRYPVTRTVDVIDDYHGTRVTDPFRWLEDLADEGTRAWAAAQNALLEGHLAGDGVRERVRARLTRMLARLEDFSNALPPQQSEGREFFMHTNSDGAALYVRTAPGAEPRLLVDPRSFSEHAGVSEFWVAPDSRHVAYALSDGGAEWVELRVRNVDTGADLPEVLQGMIYPSIAWTRDSGGFLYTHAERSGPEKLVIRRNPAVHYHLLGTAQERDPLIFSTPPGTSDLVLSVGISEDGRYAFIYEGSGSYQGALGWAFTRMHFLDLKQGEHPDFSGRPVAVNARPDAAYNVVGSDGSVAYVLTSRDAPRHRVVAVDLQDPVGERWRDVIPQAEGVLQSVHRVGGRWVAAYVEDVHSVLRVFSDDGAALEEIDLPTLGSVFAIHGASSAPEVTFTFSSFTHPDAVLRHDLDTGTTTTVRRLENGFDGDGYETRQLWFTSRDGTGVPMFVVHRKGIPMDGSNSTILYGYGSSGTSLLPEFSEGAAMWLELGGVYAVANVRGGGEFGQAWYEAATLDRKQTSFDDFIAAAEHLISTGYTTPQRLAIHGHSFGGLLVGAAMTQRPELFAAAISENPVLDMLRRDPGQHAAQYGWVADPADFPFLFAYSPLHAVTPGTCYPATLVTTAFNDDRVPAWHAFKFTAALQAAQSCPQPVMLRVADSGGHAGSWGDADLAAEIWAFAAGQTGLEGSGPGLSPEALPARQPADPAVPIGRIDALVEAARVEMGLPGVSIVLLQGDSVLLARGYGLADIENDVPATEHTVYGIGSLSKQFAAAAVMRLVEQGRVGLDDPVHTHLQDFPEPGTEITIRHLLRQTSGLPDYGSFPEIVAIREGADVEPAQFDLAGGIRLIGQAPRRFEPGEWWSYSGSNYLLLTVIVERVTGASFHDYASETLLEPLGLHTTHVCGLPDRGARARGYDAENGSFTVRLLARNTADAGAGGLCSSAMEIALWKRALVGGRAVAASSLRQMIEVAPFGAGFAPPYGFGLSLVPVAGRPAMWHTGVISGHTSVLAHLPEDDLTIAMITNRRRADLTALFLRVGTRGARPPGTDFRGSAGQRRTDRSGDRHLR